MTWTTHPHTPPPHETLCCCCAAGRVTIGDSTSLLTTGDTCLSGPVFAEAAAARVTIGDSTSLLTTP